MTVLVTAHCADTVYMEFQADGYTVAPLPSMHRTRIVCGPVLCVTLQISGSLQLAWRSKP